MNNADMPAMPCDDLVIRDDKGSLHGATISSAGLTKREHFCLQMGVPETGDPELDDIIRKGNKQELTVMAMQGLLSSGRLSDVSEKAVMYAYQTLKEINK